jgi:tetratricopeptide (TPR) repeat protein
MNGKNDQPMALGARLAPAAALLLMAVVAYFPAFYCGFIWDDDAYVTDNQSLSDVTGLRQIWLELTASPQYYPLVFTSFWAERHLWGLHPLGYHVTNVFLHGLNGVLLFLVLKQLRVPVPWFVAAVFILHPVHVESVAWITERKNVLSGFFYLAAALAYFRFSPPDLQPARPLGRWGWYALALVLFLGALLSKTVTCSLPAALLLVLWWKRERLRWRDVAALAPFFALGASLALVTVWLEKNHVGAQGSDWDLSPMGRILVAGRSLWFYAGKLVWPSGLSFIYPRWDVDSRAAWQYVFPAAAIAAAVACWLGRRRWGLGPFVACLFFAGTLFPALGFFDVYPMRYSFVADHFQYLASVGVLAVIVAAGRAVLQRMAADRPAVPIGVGALGLFVLTLLTWAQTDTFADLKTLWTETLVENPDCWLAHNNLGNLLLDERKYDEAQRHYQEAVRLKPNDPHNHHNLGQAYWFQGKIEQAASAFEEAVRLDPNYAEAHFKLGFAFRRREKIDDAIAHFQTAVRLRPDFVDARNNLGVALAFQGKYTEAIAQFQEAARFEPNDPAIYVNLARAHKLNGQLNEAIEQARRAVELRPEDVALRQMLEGLIKERGKPGK